MSRVIHFFNYLEYEDLEGLQFKFNEPYKNSISGIYSSELKEPIHFYLPKSEILEVYQDDFGINKITYKVDTISHPELLEFCDNLDSLCINLACINSKKWFGKEINADILIKYLNSVYNISEIDEGITIDIDINDMTYLDKLSDYNNNDNMNLLITISAIEFFKQTFRIKLQLNSILEGIPQDYNKEESDLEMDFNEMLEKSTNIPENTDNIKENNIDLIINQTDVEINNQHRQKEATEINKNIENTDIIENTDVIENTNIIENKNELMPQTDISNEIINIQENNRLTIKENNEEIIKENKQDLQELNVINNETIDELANTNNNKISENITSNDFNDLVSKETINELESLISQKKVEKKKYLMNAERARRASANLVTKATKLDTEISDYENKLKNISESVVSNFS